MNEQAMRFRVGVFVLFTMILLAVLVTLFGRLPSLFKQTRDYTVVFTEAPGVAPGTPVRRSGVPIGRVQSVKLDDETGKVMVHVQIDKEHTIRHSDQAVLAHALLGGDTTIDFIPPKPGGQEPDKTPVEPGSEIVGAEQADVHEMLNQTAELLPTTQETLNEIRKSVQHFDPLAPQMEKAIQEYRDLGKATRDMIPELRQTNDEVRQLTHETRQIVPELRRTNEEIQVTSRNWGKLGERLDVLMQTNQDKLIKTLDNFNDTIVRVGTVFNDENQRNLSATLKNVRSSSDNLESLTKNADDLVKDSRQTVHRVNDSITQTNDVLGNLQQATKPMAQRSDSVMKNLDEFTDKLNKLLGDIRTLQQGVNGGDGTLQRLLTDPALYNNLNDSACMLTRIMPRLDRMMQDLEVFADKVARHPESLGVGGAVKPSSGLKEAPIDGSAWPRH